MVAVSKDLLKETLEGFLAATAPGKRWLHPSNIGFSRAREFDLDDGRFFCINALIRLEAATVGVEIDAGATGEDILGRVKARLCITTEAALVKMSMTSEKEAEKDEKLKSVLVILNDAKAGNISVRTLRGRANKVIEKL